MQELNKTVLDVVRHAGFKALSGRLIATIAVNFAGVWMLINQIPMPGEFVAMWGVVTTFYFTRERTP